MRRDVTGFGPILVGVVLGRSTSPHDYGAPGAVAARVLTLAGVPVLMHVAA